jgi:hypothetical protein
VTRITLVLGNGVTERAGKGTTSGATSQPDETADHRYRVLAMRELRDDSAYADHGQSRNF